jgi:hypothetical protein
MSETDATQFIESLNKLCGEASEAARLSPNIFTDDELKQVKRHLAKCMEIIDGEVIPILKKHHPNIKGIPYE